MGRVPLARLRPRARRDARSRPSSTPAICSIRRRCAGSALHTTGVGSADRWPHRHHRWCRVRRVAPLPHASSSAATKSSPSTTCPPGRRENVAELEEQPDFELVRRGRLARDPGRRAGRRRPALREPREPARVPRDAARDDGRQLARHPQRARPRARERRALPRRVDERDLRRPARAPADRGRTTATSTPPARVRSTTKRSASPRR